MIFLNFFCGGCILLIKNGRNGRMAEFVVLSRAQLISALLVPTYQTNLPHQWSAAGSASVLRIQCERRGGRAEEQAQPRRNEMPLLSSLPCSKGLPLVICYWTSAAERERQRERQSMAHTMAGKWRPFMRLRVQLLRRCFWGMMMQDHWLLREERKGARKAQVKPICSKMPCCSKQSTVH